MPPAEYDIQVRKLMKPPKGLKVSDVRIGSGPVAEKGKVALLHYDLFLPRGDRCASSRTRPYPVQMRVGLRMVVPAIAYAVPGMAVGGIRRVKVSPNLAYYERKVLPDIPANASLRYELELIRVSDAWDNSIYEDHFPEAPDPADCDDGT